MAYPPLAGNPRGAAGLAGQCGAGHPRRRLRARHRRATPQPYGMPPFRTLLSDTEIAAVTSFIRQRWGNQAGAVTSLDVQAIR